MGLVADERYISSSNLFDVNKRFINDHLESRFISRKIVNNELPLLSGMFSDAW
jgi:hypothetical protein